MCFAALCLLLTACGGGGGGGGGVSLGGGTDVWNGDAVSITIPFTRSRAGFSQGLMDLNPKSISLKVTATKTGATKVLYDETFSGEQVITVKAAVGSRLDATATVNLEGGETRTASGVLERVAKGANTLTVYVEYKYKASGTFNGTIYDLGEGTYNAQTGFVLPATCNNGLLACVNFICDSKEYFPGRVTGLTGDKIFTATIKDPYPFNLQKRTEGGIEVYTITGLKDSALTEITIPGKIGDIPVKYIQTNAFRENSTLTKVVIEDGVEQIGDTAFYKCTSLSALELPSTLVSIGDTAFYQCTFSSVKLPSSLKKIGGSAFNSCNNLSSVNIPEGVTEIGGRAFGYTALTSVTLPSTLETFGDSVFSGTTISAIPIPPKVTALPEDAFSGTKITSMVIPNTVTSLGKKTFYQCGQLTSVTLSTGIKTIGWGVFGQCYKLPTLDLCNVEEIEQYAINYCNEMTKITMPKVNKLDAQSITNCSKLKTLEFGLTTPPEITGDKTQTNTTVTKIIVPQGTDITVWQSADIAALFPNASFEEK